MVSCRHCREDSPLNGEEDKDGVLQRTYVQQPGLRYGATLAEAPGADPASAAYR